MVLGFLYERVPNPLKGSRSTEKSNEMIIQGSETNLRSDLIFIAFFLFIGPFQMFYGRQVLTLTFAGVKFTFDPGSRT